jgi:hypothetical protein
MEPNPRFERYRTYITMSRPHDEPAITAAYDAMLASPPVADDPAAPDMRLDVVADLLTIDMLIDFRYGVVTRDNTNAEIRSYVVTANKLVSDRLFGRAQRDARWMSVYNDVAILQSATDPGTPYAMLEAVRQAMVDDEQSLANIAAILLLTWAPAVAEGEPMMGEWLVSRTIHHLENQTNGDHR